MISTTEIVENLIKESPLLEDGLARGIISYSALARDLRPQIEKKLLKSVGRGAIVMALKRTSEKLKTKKNAIQQLVNLSGITARSNLAELTYLNSDTIIEKHKKVFLASEKRKDIFCNLSQGVRETMLIVGEEILPEMEKIFADERLVAKIKDLSSITILLAKETVSTSGVYYSILKLLAWNEINIIDVISTYSELTIILSNSDIDKAFSILKNYKSV
jgi:DNA-binding transcriptional ArsR family regulator